jgi:hypothetical protein
LALIVILVVRSLRSFGSWIGWSVILSGIGIVVALMILQITAINSLTNVVTSTSSADQFEAEMGILLAQTLLSQISGSILGEAVLFVGIGLVLLFVSWIFSSRGSSPGGSVIVLDDGRIISTTGGFHKEEVDK